MRATLLVVLLLAGCAAPAPPDAPPEGPPSDEPLPEGAPPPRLASWPAWEVGDSWTWRVTSFASDGRRETASVSGTVVEVTEDRYRLETVESDGTVSNATYWRANLTLVGARGDALVLPLEPGATWRSGGFRAVAVGVANVTTPAGTFGAWHVNLTSPDGAGGAFRDDWWSPEAKVWVKARLVRYVSGGDRFLVERELQEATLASGARWPSAGTV